MKSEVTLKKHISLVGLQRTVSAAKCMKKRRK